MTRVGYPFVPAPQRLSLLWSECSFFERAVAGEAFRSVQGQPSRFSGDWRDALCCAMAVPGKERPNVKRALASLQSRGLIVVENGTIDVLFVDAQVDVRTTSDASQVAVRSTSGRGQVAVSLESSQRNHSSHDPQIERIDRSDKTDRYAPAYAREEPPIQDPEPWRERPSVLETPAGRVRVAFEQRYLEKRAVPPRWSPKAIEACAAISGWVETLPRQEGALERLLEGFFSDVWAESKGFPIAALANDPPRYFDPPKATAAKPVRRTAAVVKAEREALFQQGRFDELTPLTKEIAELEAIEEAMRYGRR